MGLPRYLHLLLSGIIVILAGLVYGIHPSCVIPLVLNFEVDALALKNIFRAIMGIYLGLGIFWLIGAHQDNLWKSATLCNVLFMGGIVLGRLVSLFADGFSLPFFVAMVLELLFFIWGAFNLRVNNS